MNAVPMYDFAGPGAGGQGSGPGGAPWVNQRLVDAHAKPCHKQLAVLTHATAFAAMFLGIPVLFPFLVWIFKKNDSAFLDDHGREQMNFQISFILMTLICVILVIPTLGIAALFLVAYYIVGLVSLVRGMIAASNGEYFRYPMTIRLIPS